MTFCFSQFLPQMREKSSTTEFDGFVTDETCSVVEEVQYGSASILDYTSSIRDEGGCLNGSMYFSISPLGEVERFGASLFQYEEERAEPLGVQILKSDEPEYIVRCIRRHDQNGVRFVWTPFSFSGFDYSDYFDRKMVEAQEQIESAIESIVDKKKEEATMRNSFFLSEQMLRVFPFLEQVRAELTSRRLIWNPSETISSFVSEFQISDGKSSLLEEEGSHREDRNGEDYSVHVVVTDDGIRVLSYQEWDCYGSTPTVGEQLFSSGEEPKFIVRCDFCNFEQKSATWSIYCFGGFNYEGYFSRKLGEAADLIQSETESLLDEQIEE